MTQAWWRHVAPAREMVECAGVRHRVVWEAGEVSFPAHDLDAELALAALGGRRSECLLIFELWESVMCRPVGGVLIDTLAGGDDPATRVVRGLRSAGRGHGFNPGVLVWAAQSWASEASGGGHRLVRQLAAIEMLPEPLRDRLALSAVAGHALTGRPALAKSSAQAVLGRYAVPALQEHLTSWRRLIGDVRPVGCEALATGERASLDVLLDGRAAAARLPLEWLWTVWARGIACVRGLFVLEVVDEPSDDHVRVRAVRWGRVTERGVVPQDGLALLGRTPGGWSAVWEG